VALVAEGRAVIRGARDLDAEVDVEPAGPASCREGEDGAAVDWYWMVFTVCPLSVSRELVTIGNFRADGMVSPDRRRDWLTR